MDLLDLARAVSKQVQALGAQESTISVSRSSEVSLTRRAGKLEQAQQATSLGVSLSLLVDDRFSSHSTSDLRPAPLAEFLERAIAATRFLEPEIERRQADLADCGRAVSEDVLDPFDATHAAVTAAERRERVAALEATVDALPERGRIKSATVSLGDSTDEGARVMSNGFEGRRRSTGFVLGAEFTLEEPGGKRPEAYSYYSASHASDVPSAAFIAAEAWERAEQRLNSGPAPSGRYPMVLQNFAAGRVLGVLGGPLSGSELHQGRSCLAGKIGERIAASTFSLSDDPFIPRGAGSRPWDGDGLRARPLSIIRDGVLENYYIGVYYGRKLGMPTTTGGRSNWVVPPGERTPAELLAALPKCIVVTGFLGGNSNGLTGDFSFGVQGLLMEHGEVTQHLSEMNVSGNILDVLGRFSEAANDPYRYGATRTPSLLFDDVQFSGA